MVNKKKILIVDDEKFVTDTLEGFFRSKGYEIFKAEDGQTSLSVITNEKPDLVLLDIKLPKVDGMEILKLLRQYYSKVKVIVMTAYSVEYKKIAESIGFDDFFVKPILVDELLVRVEELLSEAKPPISSQEVKKEIPDNSSAAIPVNILPKARILVISPRDLIIDLLKEYFTNQEICNGIYEVSGHGLEQLESSKDFNPDIVLFDLALVGLLGAFGLTLMKMPKPPKETIIFGDPATKWEEAEERLKKGARFVEMRLDLKDAAPIKNTLQLLNNAVREVCAKYRLFNN